MTDDVKKALAEAQTAWDKNFDEHETHPDPAIVAAARLMRALVPAYNEAMMAEAKRGISAEDLARAVNSMTGTMTAMFLANALQQYHPFMHPELVDIFCREQDTATREALKQIGASGGPTVDLKTGRRVAVGREGSIIIPPGAMERKQ